MIETVDSGSIPGRVKPKTIKNGTHRFHYLLDVKAINRASVKSPPCVVDRWQLDAKTKRPFGSLLAKVPW